MPIKTFVTVFLIHFILHISNTHTIQQSTPIFLQPATYKINISQKPEQRYKQIILDKKQELNSFIQRLYQIPNFKYSMYLSKFILFILPQQLIRFYFGKDLFNEFKGIAKYSQRQIYEIIVYNYMYEIGASKDFCTSIAITQIFDDKNGHKQNVSLLARNLDYGFQDLLAKNTIKIHFYQNDSRDVKFTTLTHSGFVSSHTVLKYQDSLNMQFAMSLNQRKSSSLINRMIRILFDNCQSVFQITNKLLTTNIHTIQELIQLVQSSNSCAKFYFIIHTLDGVNVLIQKNEGVGVDKVIVQNKVTQPVNKPFYILQTNTDVDKPDPDGRRDEGKRKMQQKIKLNGFISRQQIKNILLQSPNFNNLTLMTAIIDIRNAQIQTFIWNSPQQKQKQFLLQ